MVAAYLFASAISFLFSEPQQKIIEFNVSNLDCVQGNSGTFKMLLRPDWGGIGASRIEVRDFDRFILDCIKKLKYIFLATILSN